MLRPLPASSGDLRVDRRYQFALGLAAEGDAIGAAELLSDALRLAPDWVAGWHALGGWLAQAGDEDGAKAAYDRVLLLDPADRFGATLARDLLRKMPLTETMPSAFVETLFDGYAPSFEAELVGKLGYRVPARLRGALSGRFDRALDLGCGTGLMGAELRGICGNLEGWDISTGMLREAEAKGIYDRLERQDLSTLSAPEAQWDLIAAADVMMYLGALDAVVGWSALALRPGGVLAISVELCETGFELGEARRYRHSRGYVEALLLRAGFTGLRFEEVVLRHDRGQPVAGLIVTASRLGTVREGEGEAAALA